MEFDPIVGKFNYFGRSSTILLHQILFCVRFPMHCQVFEMLVGLEKTVKSCVTYDDEVYLKEHKSISFKVHTNGDGNRRFFW